MKFGWLVWSALARRPLRSALTILAISVAFLLFGLLKGFTLAFDAMVQEVPAYRLDTYRRSLSLGGGLPFAYVERIKSLPGVADVTYGSGMSGTYGDERSSVTLIGIDLDSRQRVMPETRVSDGDAARFRSSRTSALVGSEIAAELGWAVGQRITFNVPDVPTQSGSDMWSFEVAGTWSDETVPSRQVFIHYDYLDAERAVRRGLVYVISVLVDEASSPIGVANLIDQAFLNSATPTRTMATRDRARTSMRQLGDVEFFVNAIVGSALFAILFVTSGTLMQSVRERVPELAVLRAIGFGKGQTVAILIGEAVVLALAGTLIGVSIARVISPSIYATMTQSTLSLPWTLYAYAAGAAVTLAVVAVSIPAVRAYRVTVAEALVDR